MNKLDKARRVFDQVECALLSLKAMSADSADEEEANKLEQSIEGLESGLGWVEDFVDYLRSENE